MTLSRPSVLGKYLLVLASYQILLYSWSGHPVLLDPRMGWAGKLARDWGERTTLLTGYASALWLLALGLMILRSSGLRVKMYLVIYIASELVLSGPTVLATAMILVLGGGEFWTRLAVLPYLLPVVIGFTVIPIGLAIICLRTTRNTRASTASSRD